jgi:quercetin dioxygenase-like cupin family protein
MKVEFAVLAAVVVAIAVPTTAMAQTSAEHKIIQSQDIKWEPASPALPAGAQVAVLLGDPSKEGLYVLRLKVPKGYRLPPHKHPNQEVVTVISGMVKLGMGEAADPAKAKTLPVGTLYAVPPGMAHFVQFEEDTVIQVSTIGPSGFNYISAKDDPRQKAQ